MMRVLIAVLLAVSLTTAAESETSDLHNSQLPLDPLKSSQGLQRNKKEDLGPRSERLTQPATPDHVYLPNGRPQPVEYITSPVARPQQPTQQAQDFRNAKSLDSPYGNAAQLPVRYIEDPFAGDVPLLAQDPQVGYLSYPQRNQRYQVINNLPYTEEPAEVAIEYLQFPSVFPQEQLAKYRSPGTNERQYTAPRNQNPFTTSPQSSRLEEPQAYLARLQYPEVQPISAPVYPYSPQPVIRIFRHLAPES